MDEEMTDSGNGVALEAEGKTTKKQLLSLYHDSSIADTRANAAVDVTKRKCGRKVRRKSGTKKHRAGKNRRRRYKPYHRLSAAERRKVDERNEKRNSRRREFLHSCGVSMAPQNTTQFLVADRRKTRSLSRRIKEGDNSDPSSPSEYDRSDSWESDDFQAMWVSECNQRFEKMTMPELREYFVNLEDEIERQEKKIAEGLKIQVYQEEVKRHEIAIEELIRLNAGLTKMLEDIPCKTEKDVDRKDQSLESVVFSVDTGTKLLEDMPCKAEKDVDKKDQSLESVVFSVDTGTAV